MNATSTTRESLTSTTWSEPHLAQSGVSRHSGLSWMAQSDLGHELAERFENLDVAAGRALVEAASNGLPLILTFKTRGLGNLRVTAIVNQLHGFYETSGAMVRYWGFSYPVRLKDIVAVEVPSAEYDV